MLTQRFGWACGIGFGTALALSGGDRLQAGPPIAAKPTTVKARQITQVTPTPATQPWAGGGGAPAAQFPGTPQGALPPTPHPVTGATPDSGGQDDLSAPADVGLPPSPSAIPPAGYPAQGPRMVVPPPTPRAADPAPQTPQWRQPPGRDDRYDHDHQLNVREREEKPIAVHGPGYTPGQLPPPGTLGYTYTRRSTPVGDDKHPRSGIVDVYLPKEADVSAAGMKPKWTGKAWRLETELPLLPGVPHIYAIKAEWDSPQGRVADIRWVRLIMGRIVEVEF